jgi:hypothetical protein
LLVGEKRNMAAASSESIMAFAPIAVALAAAYRRLQ